MDYITATWKVGLGNKNDALVPSVPQCLCPKIVRQSKFRTNSHNYIESNKRYPYGAALNILVPGADTGFFKRGGLDPRYEKRVGGGLLSRRGGGTLYE